MPPGGGNQVFKVTSDQRSGVDVTLRLEGRLTGVWVDELARAVDSAMSGHATVTLNLDGLSFADHRGVAVIRGAVERGARSMGGSEFIGRLIWEEAR